MMRRVSKILTDYQAVRNCGLLKEYRASKRMTQCDLAEALHVDQSIISNMESAIYRVSVSMYNYVASQMGWVPFVENREEL